MCCYRFVRSEHFEILNTTRYDIMPQQFFEDSIFWVEVDKIHPNPYQPRKEFDEGELQSLADSIHQYGVLQALVVTRNEEQKEDGSGLHVYYELVSGERRLRASKLAGVKQVPVLIRTGEESKQMKLELAIIENVQREDLNVVDRGRAFRRLIDEFNFSHSQVAKKVGKSREYITNSLRILALPEYILNALSDGTLSEGHGRPLMMLNDRTEEQETLYKEIIYKKMSVREAERVARKIARDKTRKKGLHDDPKTAELEKEFAQSLGTRVHIQRKEQGGKLSIDFFSDDDLSQLLEIFKKHGGASSPNDMMERFIKAKQRQQTGDAETVSSTDIAHKVNADTPNSSSDVDQLQGHRLHEEREERTDTVHKHNDTPDISENSQSQQTSEFTIPTENPDVSDVNMDYSDTKKEMVKEENTPVSESQISDQHNKETNGKPKNVSYMHQQQEEDHVPRNSFKEEDGKTPYTSNESPNTYTGDMHTQTATTQHAVHGVETNDSYPTPNESKRSNVEDKKDADIINQIHSEAHSNVSIQTDTAEQNDEDNNDDDLYSVQNFTI